MQYDKTSHAHKRKSSSYEVHILTRFKALFGSGKKVKGKKVNRKESEMMEKE